MDRMLLIVLAAATCLGCGGDPPVVPSAAVTLDDDLYLFAPDGRPVLLAAGPYEALVLPDDEVRLRSSAGDEHAVLAARVDQVVPVAEPRAFLMDRSTESPRLVVLLPDGSALDAPASRTGTRTRGAKPVSAWRIGVAYARAVADPSHEVKSSTLGSDLDRAARVLEAADIAAGVNGGVPERERGRILEGLVSLEETFGEGSDAFAARGAPGREALAAIRGSVARSRVRIDEARIYWGNPKRFDEPAEVDVDAVYMKIPEYRKIVDRDLDDRDPRYFMLLRAASGRFLHAVETLAEKDGYDLIGGKGSIEIPGRKIPDVTKEAILHLPD